MGRPLRRLLAERRVERIDERFGGRGHRGLLRCVHRRPPLERSLPPSYAPRVLAFRRPHSSFYHSLFYAVLSGHLLRPIQPCSRCCPHASPVVFRAPITSAV